MMRGSSATVIHLVGGRGGAHTAGVFKAIGAWVTTPPAGELARITTVRAEAEVDPASVGMRRADVDAIWAAAVDLYASRTQPALSLCVRHKGQVLIDRAIGHVRGTGPDDPPGAPAPLATPATPYCIFSASKAVTAVLMHELDARNLLRLDDPVAEYIPEFAAHKKGWITLRHVLTHRAGLPVVPLGYDPLLLADDWDRVIALLCDARPASVAGRRLAYHAITGGYILGEAARRATGEPVERLLDRYLGGPLAASARRAAEARAAPGEPYDTDAARLRYGHPADRLDEVAVNHFTGLPVPFPISRIIKRSLGLSMAEAVAASNDPRFLASVIPSGNVVTTADTLGRFFQLLLDEGVLDGEQVLDRRGVRRARVESANFEVDFTLGIPIRYGQGLMLGARPFGLFGPDARKAFGHYGFINIIGWADPERDVSAALLTSGKPIIAGHFRPLWALLRAIATRAPRREA